jgi:hypothetical protein
MTEISQLIIHSVEQTKWQKLLIFLFLHVDFHIFAYTWYKNPLSTRNKLPMQLVRVSVLLGLPLPYGYPVQRISKGRCQNQELCQIWNIVVTSIVLSLH